jgi:glutathione S-transferase
LAPNPATSHPLHLLRLQLHYHVNRTPRLNKSRGQRIIWLLEELKLDYDIKTYARNQEKRAPKELRDVHPLGKSPTVTIQVPARDKPLVLAESGPIVEYLCEHFGQHLVPKRYPEGKDGGLGEETDEWIDYRVCHWLPCNTNYRPYDYTVSY